MVNWTTFCLCLAAPAAFALSAHAHGLRLQCPLRSPSSIQCHEQWPDDPHPEALAELPADMSSTSTSAAKATAEADGSKGSGSSNYVQDIAPQVLRARFVMQNWAQPSFSRVRISYERVLQKHPAVRAQCRWLDAAGQQQQQQQPKTQPR